MPKETMFCPRCNEWVKEPSVQSWGPQWTRFYQGLCPKCEACLEKQKPAPVPSGEKGTANPAAKPPVIQNPPQHSTQKREVIQPPSVCTFVSPRRGFRLRGLFSRKSTGSKSRYPQQPLVIKVTCRKCGTVYDFGKDAFVEAQMTMAQVWEFMRSEGTRIVGTPSAEVLPEELEKGALRPDNVYMARRSPLPPAKRQELLKESLEMIAASLSRGDKREWCCWNCGEVQRYR